MIRPILYMGDDALDRAAAYLGGVLAHAKLAFDYAPSGRNATDELLAQRRSLYIIGDYPVKRFGPGHMERIAADVRDGGAGLAMLGGWESFHGAAGEYIDTPIAELLPVELARHDDRVNCAQPCLMRLERPHPIVDGLPFDRPPCIGGYNLLTPRDGANVVLTAQRFDVTLSGGQYAFTPRANPAPLLVTGQAGQGRVTAFATDAAPHWVGGFVDWGNSRIEAQAEGGNAIEVGNLYAQFLTQLVRWTGKV